MSVAKLRFLAQLWILLAIAASMALLMDSLGGAPAYCADASGCLAAKHAARKWLGPVPLPLLGSVAFGVWYVATTLAHIRRLMLVELAGSILAALSGIGLLLVQALVLRTYCPFCVVVDVSAILAGCALLTVWFRRRTDAGPSQYLNLQSLLCLGVVAIVAPVVWPYFRPATRVPPELAEFQQPNRMSVVEFVDLECSHCRALFPKLEQLRQEYADRIRFVRLHAPLSSHKTARLGARLLVCLEPDETRIEQLNRILFETPELDRQSIVAAAEGVGMSESEVDACWADPASDTAVDRNVNRLHALGFEGLPTTYIAGERVVGAMPLLVYETALDRAYRSSSAVAWESTVFYLVFAALVGGLIWIGRKARVERHEQPASWSGFR